MESIFKDRDLADILEEIQEVYTKHDYPWVIGYSGGKDSTASMQLVWQAISRLPEEKRTKPIYIISTNTLVETPAIVDHVQTTHKRITRQAEEESMPFSTHKLEPQVDDTFWVNLIGPRLSSPQQHFPLVHGPAQDPAVESIHPSEGRRARKRHPCVGKPAGRERDPGPGAQHA